MPAEKIQLIGDVLPTLVKNSLKQKKNVNTLVFSNKEQKLQIQDTLVQVLNITNQQINQELYN